MRGFRLKPNLKTIDLQHLQPEQVEYFCTTQQVDKRMCDAAGIAWNQELADFMEEKARMYFLVKTNMEYDVVSGPVFEKLNEEWNLIQNRDISDKAKKCINHYIKALK